MDAATRRFIRERAGNRCEYCQLSQEHSPLFVLQIELRSLVVRPPSS
ncbi:MAG TPA: hypothetical protein VFV87_07510 [Pirellulaceae bacterium]|nr:hypothetical protein [Pirellulaceae bacterium]